jgi:hypothetical protein
VIAVYRTVFAVYSGGIFAFGYRFPSGRKNPAGESLCEGLVIGGVWVLNWRLRSRRQNCALWIGGSVAEGKWEELEDNKQKD